MIPFRTSAAALLTAVALAAVPATAVAHSGSHPFKNCTEAYDNGYSNIPEGDRHYGGHLDRDKDGVGCDQPPSDFVPRDESDDAGAEAGAGAGGAKEGNGGGTDLAETGGSDTTPYIAAGGGAVVLLGGGLMIAARRRRENR
ncbi:LAETG motif-containing sortase-dependent surface protein [Streptomyces sp. NPDC014764]|uniref:LAETG motif-containing sortase-dependent surface protein n=1 Tax=Streptomyces sp. NPDC014764 TaxID=3364907 RepID=UPI0036F859E6